MQKCPDLDQNLSLQLRFTICYRNMKQNSWKRFCQDILNILATQQWQSGRVLTPLYHDADSWHNFQMLAFEALSKNACASSEKTRTAPDSSNRLSNGARCWETQITSLSGMWCPFCFMAGWCVYCPYEICKIIKRDLNHIILNANIKSLADALLSWLADFHLATTCLQAASPSAWECTIPFWLNRKQEVWLKT